MADINKVRTDPEKELQGVWTDFAEGIRLKIARAGNPAYRKLLRELSEPHIKDIRNGTMDEELNSTILKKVRAITILLDWENIEENGQEVSYSKEKALEYFMDPSLRDFYLFVVIESENMDLFRKEVIEEAIKN
jgi:hypothetical protein